MVESRTRTPVSGRLPDSVQHLPFTCGPAALIAYMQDGGFAISNDIGEQIEIWRRANTGLMSMGAAGCSGEGLALAAAERGLKLTVISSSPGFDFAETVRDPAKKALIRHIVKLQRRQLVGAGLASRTVSLTSAESLTRLIRDRRFLILVRQSYISAAIDYHWIYVRPSRDGRIEVLDPYLSLYPRLKWTPSMKGDFFYMDLADFVRRTKLGNGILRSLLMESN